MRVTVRVTVMCSLKNVCFTNSVMEYLSNVRVTVRVTVMCSLKNVCLTAYRTTSGRVPYLLTHAHRAPLIDGLGLAWARPRNMFSQW